LTGEHVAPDAPLRSRRGTPLLVPAVTPPARDLVALAQRWRPLLLGGYLAVIALATLLNLGWDPEPANAWYRFGRAFRLSLGTSDVIDAARNVALFVGWGTTVALTARPPATWRTIVTATLTGCLASLSVELLQTFSSFRVASIVDVATNTLGAFVGATTLVLAERRMRSDVRRGTLLGAPAWLAALALVAACTGLVFSPASRPAGIASWARSPFARLAEVRAAPVAPAAWPAYLPDALAFAALGLLAAIAVADRGGRLRLPQLAGWVAILAALVGGMPIARGMAGIAPDPRAQLVHAVAVALGLAAGLALAPRWARGVPVAATRCAQVALLPVACLLAWNWWPATWGGLGRPGFAWQQFVPMLALYARHDFGSVFIVLQKVGLGGVLGACVAGRRAQGVAQPGLRAVALLATAVEAGQYLVPGRYPDVTDVLMVTGGAAVTAALALRAVVVEGSGRGAPATAGPPAPPR
jgi:VanZ family protein